MARPGLCMQHAGPLDGSVPSFQAEDSSWHRAFGHGPGEFVFGHRHEAGRRRIGELDLICTGSVGSPADRDARASYVILDLAADEVGPVHHRVEYDRESTAKAFEALGPFGAWVAGGIRHGMRAPATWNVRAARSP